MNNKCNSKFALIRAPHSIFMYVDIQLGNS